MIALSRQPLGKEVFRYWFTFLKPLHNLTDREVAVLAAFARHRFEMMEGVNDEKLLDSLLMSSGTKRKVREECGLSLAHFQVIMSKLKKNKVVVDNRINPKLLPKMDRDTRTLSLLLLFPIS